MNIFASYTAFKKDNAIRYYLKKLPTILASSYGQSDHYSPQQVIKAIELSLLAQYYKSYAVAMFCDREAFESYYQTAGEPWVYDDIRAKIANLHFNNNIYFSVSAAHSLFDGSDDSASDDSSDSGSSDGGGGD